MTQTQHPLAGLLKECPEFFYTRTVNGRDFAVPNYITWEVKRAMEKADQEAYRTAKPEECKDGIDFTKFNAWVTSDEGDKATNEAESRVLFLPKDGGEPINARMIPLTTWREAQNFFDRPLPSNSSAPTAATANSEALNAGTPQG